MSSRRWARGLIAGLDRGFRALHALDAEGARVAPALRVELRRSRRGLALADGAVVRRGEPIGMLHLDNDRIAALHREDGGRRPVGLVFRRRFVASLESLAARAADGGDLAGVRAFAALTIFGGLERVGFAEAAGDRLRWASGVAWYQRLLLATLHPAGAARPGLSALTRARRLWISRERLLALHGPARRLAVPRDPGQETRTMPMGQPIVLEPYEGSWPPDDPDAGFRRLVADYSRIDPMPTLETLSRHKGIPVGALVGFVLARYCTSGSDALLEMGPRVARQMDGIVREAEGAGTDEARLRAYAALKAIVSWLLVPLDDPGWGPGSRRAAPDARD